ncbi:MMPL family transporter [Paenibacillus sp. Marseille-P2973]|uniref:MMPL family transporter n=1 Tax=Paenibacillus sp. Marseille-P2973 TaxID=1871032 RepID=UPI001B37B005|nr:MMPL family transporter [Paenibacillus sp. Marseille-P2973]MBQ4901099.1 MMPL family transporter [Paenibacillus sp. Marseille-P2973]
MLLKQMGRWVAGKRTKWITLAVWVIIVGVLSAVWPGVNQMEKNNAANLDSGKPSVKAGLVAETEFPAESGIPALIVWNREGGLTEEDYGGIQKLTAYFAEHPVTGQGALPPFDKLPLPVLQQQASEDGAAFVLPFFFEKTADSDTMKQGTEEIRKQAETLFGADPFAADLNKGELSARVSGPAGISIDAVGLFSNADVSLMIATVLLVLILLLLIYRSPLLAIIPLIAVGFAYGAASPILGKMAELGWITVDSQAISIMTVLLFGAGTDYCLFLISRFRQLLTIEKDKSKALFGALKDSSGAIAMSGFTVVIALLVLLLAKYGAVHRFAVPFSLSILIMAIASLTLVPAILAILGRTSFYPFVPRTPEMETEHKRAKGKTTAVKTKKKNKVGGRIGVIVTKRPWLVVIVTLVFLGAAAVNSFRIQYTVDLLSSFPEDSPSREGFAVIGEKFTPGELAPVKIMVDTERQDIPLQKTFEELPYVSKVSEPTAGKNNPNISAVDVEFNINPYSMEAVNHIPDLREAAEKALADAGISAPEAKTWISGQPATQYDTEMTNNRDAKVIIPIVIGLIAILLLVYLRSVVATIYLILTVVLSYFSALGLGWIFVHDIMGADAIQGLIPLYAFVFLVALGEDYNIFLVSSIWKKRKTMPLKDAIREGVTETGGVITSAGLILAGTFAVLATLPIQVLVQFGIITAIGVLLDTFVVRPFLVPSITMLLGKWAFWPGRGAIDHEETTMKEHLNV